MALRRLVTIPAVFVGLPAWIALAPLLLPVALLRDLLAGTRLAATRLVLFGGYYLACEAWGLLAAAAVWIALLGGRLGGPARWARAHLGLQLAWARSLLAGATRLFGLVLEVRDSGVGHGPLLVFMRHASIVDTLLPASLLSGRHGLALRYVLKRELLMDPCLDVVGHRLPNVFLERGGEHPQREIDAMRALARNLGGNDAVLIYPEGTRASPERRARALARIEAAGEAERLERARALRHLLPPRSRGPLALLDEAAGTDVLFGAHAGLEGVVHVRDVLSGALVGRRIRVAFWRAPAGDVPEHDEARLAWLDEHWARMDRWVDEQLADEAA